MKYGCIFRFGYGCKVRDSVIFEKISCKCGGMQRLKNYYKYFYLYILYIVKHVFFYIIIIENSYNYKINRY